MSWQTNQPIPTHSVIASSMSYPINRTIPSIASTSVQPGVIAMTMQRTTYQPQNTPLQTRIMSATFNPQWYGSWGTISNQYTVKTYGTPAEPAKVGDSVRTTRPHKRRIIIGVIEKLVRSGTRELAVVEEASTGKRYRIDPIELERISPLDVLVAIEAAKGKTLRESARRSKAVS